jgi:DNA-binding Lrp family transcriptional regulator
MSMNYSHLSRQLPLKEMGESLLALEILDRAEALGFREEAQSATTLAAYLHREQRRSNRGSLPRDTYITHPLRNALRLMRWGVTDKATILSSILHDTVEDCAEELVRISPGSYASDLTEAEFRKFALMEISSGFGSEVAEIVEDVSNPLPDPDVPKATKVEKRSEYNVNVKVKTKKPKQAANKITDGIDNGSGLKHNTGMVDAARWHLASKYIPAFEYYLQRLRQPDMIILLSPDGFEQAQTALINGLADMRALIKELENTPDA